VHCPLLRDWNRDFVLTGKTDTLAQKRAKWQRLVREAQLPIDNPGTIQARIARQLGLQPDQLTGADLHSVKELSLMGRRVTDTSYLAQLPHLESLDLSFTYVESVEPLLACQQLHTLDISDTHIEDIAPLKNLPHLKTLRLWNLWLERQHIDRLQAHLPHLKIIDYQWDLYEKDPIGRVLPKRRVKLD
jgi:Leucine-rich repeat (LRR) protein